LAEAVQEVTQNSVEVAYDDQGYKGDQLSNNAQEAGVQLIVIKLPKAKKILSFYSDNGLLNAALLGQLVFAAWLVTSKDCLRLSTVFTFWTLPFSASQFCQICGTYP
jgi:hypothetical protein